MQKIVNHPNRNASNILKFAFILNILLVFTPILEQNVLNDTRRFWFHEILNEFGIILYIGSLILTYLAFTKTITESISVKSYAFSAAILMILPILLPSYVAQDLSNQGYDIYTTVFIYLNWLALLFLILGGALSSTINQNVNIQANQYLSDYDQEYR